MKKIYIIVFAILFVLFLTRQTSAVFTHRDWSNWGTCVPDHCGTTHGSQTRTCVNEVGMGSNHCSPLGKVETRSCSAVAVACSTPTPTTPPTSTPTPTVEVTPTPTEEPTPTPTIEVTPTPTVEITPTPTVEVVQSQNTVTYHDIGGDTYTDYSCHDRKPGEVAWASAHQETVNDGKVTIWYTLPMYADKVHIGYGEVGKAWEHAALNIPNNGKFTIEYLKNGIEYYFNVAGVNGCAVGNYSMQIRSKP